VTPLLAIDWVDPDQLWPNLGVSVGVLLAAGATWWLIGRMGRRWVAKLEERGAGRLAEHEKLERRQRFDTLWAVMRTMITIAIATVAVLVLLGVWGIPLAPFLAVGTVVGVGLGLGAQDFVKSVIAGFMIIIEDQYGIDDVVSVAGVSGKVEGIKLRTTVLRDLEGNVHHVPNGFITVASNLTQGFSAVVVDVAVGYREDIDRVIAVVSDEAKRFSDDPEWTASFLEPPQTLGVNLLGDWSVQVRLVFTVVPEQRWVVKREFLRRIKLRLDAEGIEIPLPHQTIVDRRVPRSQS
jgi:moderate conductance mechanosensitive channel